MSCMFHNQIRIGYGNYSFILNDGGGPVTLYLTHGVYYWDTLRNHMLTVIAAEMAGVRIGITIDGFFTIDNNGGANFSISWPQTDLRDLLGYTGTIGFAPAGNTFTAPRRIRASYYPLYATLKEHSPIPEQTMVAQTRGLAGNMRTSQSACTVSDTVFDLQYLYHGARLTSPTVCDGTTYAAAAATDMGLSEYRHARDCWWNSTYFASQGWSRGCPVRYFAAALAIGVSAGATTYTTQFTTWVFDRAVCQRWPETKARPPKTVHYHVRLPAHEYRDDTWTQAMIMPQD